MSRPKIKIDWEEIDKLAQFHCTQEEIAWFFDISVDTLERAAKREKNKSFAEFLAEKRGKGRIKLRKAQMDAALSGSVPLLIWLGKQYLGQSDKIESKENVEVVLHKGEELSKMSEQELNDFYKNKIG